MRIGPISVGGRVLLAPMAGYTDVPFRTLCRRLGAALAVSEMLTAQQRLWGTAKSATRLALDMEPEPRIVQIAGAEPHTLAAAAQACVQRGAQVVDINMGCPARKVCRAEAGSALLADEALVGRILEAVVAAVEVPVTLKMRTGTDPLHRNAVRVARLAESCGVQMLTVHGRTRRCAFRGAAEYDTIRAVRQAVSIPVVANGDIDGPDKAEAVLEYTGADAVMVGRAALGDPWVLRRIDHRLRHGRDAPEYSAEARAADILAHVRAIHRFYGPARGVRLARKHIKRYIERGPLPGAEAAWRQLATIDEAARQLHELRTILATTPPRGTLAA
ncbi:MAG TPA: tRNA dihydrouridine synthase DusB [Chromatiales bacterium]|nr:tRNA dihydrouridine synthase DusB [Chromatiales bacterium]